ncbi:DNA-3-methyladenine glycosylase II [Cladophialophora yegresii CBS 114405]|uniref:DNA-3-methyladenine glycosylase II n=1 Tax=Cladophialophora yegresii CBS 114405 TaxID=1182544 RepID=W9WKN3_9EURO|nr:DNA-3-methyladenine glycosylase II [Cladophialophora yegresii CBS 114405]EXJ59019.1 DNA-3-methyladenine glycosylase II [Cladophialophora yegresii CBS 114405]
MSVRRSTRIASIPTTVVTEKAATHVNASKKRPAGTQARSIPAKKQRSAEDNEQKGIEVSEQTNLLVNGAAKDEPEFKVPVTPAKKTARRSTPSKAKHPPLTPTPSLVNVIRAPYSSGDVEDAAPPPDRPVGPHITNAPLITPGGTQHVAYEDTLPDSTPSKTGLPRPTATANTVLDQACAHLISVDPRFEAIIAQHPCHIFSAKGLAEIIDPFRSLSSGIMGQQVSGAAAKSIKNKFIALFNEGQDPEKARFPTPAQVAATDIGRLRSAGLSQRKAEYIQGLAQKFVSGELTNDMLMKASDEEVMEKLIAVRGLGKWSVEMFACFGLKRLDILSTGDLGVQRGMAAFFGKDVKKLKVKGGGKWKYMSEQDMLDKSAPYAPYRSLFMWYMWRVEDVDVEVLAQ